jgi:isopentenyl diphosphate isomerase/L-lactate dehydrogenase-like FMN-dependent dehydrogenase
MSRLKRRLPRTSEVARFVRPTFRRRPADRWSRVRTDADFERLARRRTPRSVFDYVAGAAELELSRDRAVEVFTRAVFHPYVLRDVSAVDTTTTILSRRVALPVVLGPTGFTRMMHAAGEPAVARAAGRAGVPYVLSTLGTTSVERLAEEALATERWFQLYASRDRGRSSELVARARESGYTTLVLTVDVPVAGARHRDVYNGLTSPPTLTPGTILGMVRKPRWLVFAPPGLRRFAVDCHGLQPRGSIKAPSFVANEDDIGGLRASAGASVRSRRVSTEVRRRCWQGGSQRRDRLRAEQPAWDELAVGDQPRCGRRLELR